MDKPFFMNFFMPELLSGDVLPIMVQAAGEDTDQESLVRQKGYPSYHAMLSVSGTGKLETDMGSYDVPPGYVFMLEPNQPHLYYPISDRWHTCWVVFYGKEANAIVSRLKLAMGIPFPLLEDAIFGQIYRKICACAQENSLKGIYSASAYCYELLTSISLETSNHGESTSSGTTKSRIAPVLVYIHDNYTKDIGLEQLAECIGITPQYLCKLFQSTLAMSPCDYLQQYRLKKVKELLMDKSLSTKKIGSMCGFQDPSYFCAFFKKQVGYTPKEFRSIYGGL